MSRFATVLDLPPQLREQAEKKLAAALGAGRIVRLENRRLGPPPLPRVKAGPELVAIAEAVKVARLPKKPTLKVPATIKGDRWSRLMALQLEAHGIKGFVREHRFHPVRRWRFDWARPEVKLAVEIEGVTAAAGRHQRPKGFLNDIHKYAEALILGWRVLRVTPRLVANGKAIEYIKRALET